MQEAARDVLPVSFRSALFNSSACPRLYVPVFGDSFQSGDKRKSEEERDLCQWVRVSEKSVKYWSGETGGCGMRPRKRSLN